MSVFRAALQELLWPCRTARRVRRMVAEMTFEPDVMADDVGWFTSDERGGRAASPAARTTHRGEVDEQRAV